MVETAFAALLFFLAFLGIVWCIDQYRLRHHPKHLPHR